MLGGRPPNFLHIPEWTSESDNACIWMSSVGIITVHKQIDGRSYVLQRNPWHLQYP